MDSNSNSRSGQRVMRQRYPIIFLVVGALIFMFGLAIYLVMPKIVHDQVGALLPLHNGTLVYDQWHNTTVPTYMQFWFFSIMNPGEVLNGAKPVLRQIGPYTYREQRIKYNITFNSNTSVSYLQKRVFHFDRAKSVGDETDTLTTVNIPLVVIGDKIKDYNMILKELISGVVNAVEGRGILFQTSVKNITWGYEDPVLKDVSDFMKKLHIDFHVDPVVGLFHGKNNTDDLLYTVDSGHVNLDNFLKIAAWNGSSSLSMWHDRYANMVNGTDGSMFSPFLNKSSMLYTFQSDICRAIYATFVGQSVIKGIPSFDFQAPDRMFANHTENPANEGFCLDGYCLGAGMLNLSRCNPGGAPVVMSQPHFYAAAEKYADSVYGLSPTADCKTMLQLEPTTGLPLRLQKKLQINIAIEPISHFASMDHIPSVVMPVMWLNESALIDDQLASKIRHMLVLPVAIGFWASVAAMAVGALLVVVAFVLQLVRMLSRKSSMLIVNDGKTYNEV